MNSSVKKINARRTTFAIVLVAALAVAGIAMSFSHEGFISSELQFTSALESGLSAVPASCPSSPHYSGECDSPDLPEGQACILTASPSTISQGQGATLGWNSDEDLTTAPRSISPSVGSVSVRGSTSVSPSETTTYTFTSADSQGGPNIVCQATVTVTAGQCSHTYYCAGSSLMYRDAQCVDEEIYECSEGCLDGACIGGAEIEGELIAQPRLVRSGNTTTLTWNVPGATQCTVQAENGDSWTGISGTQVSSPLESQTTYTLSCSGEGGSLTDTETVNIIPVFQET